MPPRPFPFALRVGTDIVSISRILEAITRSRTRRSVPGTQLYRFLDRLFTHREQQIFHRQNPDFTVDDVARLPAVSEHLAGRWAAKEAAIKAAKPRKLTLLDIEILQQRPTGEMYALIRDKTFVHPSGMRRLRLTGQTRANGSVPTLAATAENAAEFAFGEPKGLVKDENDPPGQMAAISISHDKDYATAVCIAPFETIPGDVGGEAAARMYDGAEDAAAYWKH